MYNRRHSGFTLIEMVISMVIISVGIAGVLSAFSSSVKTSGDPLVHKKMLALAEEMMEEVLLKPYASAPGAITGCNRTNANDISDYAGYTNRQVCDIGGVPIDPAGYAGYTVSVALVPSTTLGTIVSGPANNVTRVTVTVRNRSESLDLVGWRTDYGS